MTLHFRATITKWNNAGHYVRDAWDSMLGDFAWPDCRDLYQGRTLSKWRGIPAIASACVILVPLTVGTMVVVGIGAVMHAWLPLVTDSWCRLMVRVALLGVKRPKNEGATP